MLGPNNYCSGVIVVDLILIGVVVAFLTVSLWIVRGHLLRYRPFLYSGLSVQDSTPLWLRANLAQLLLSLLAQRRVAAQPDRLFHIGNRPARFAADSVRHAALEIRLGIVGVDRDRTLKIVDRLIILPSEHPADPSPLVRFALARVDPDGGREVPNGPLVLAQDRVDDAATMIHLFGLMADWERQRISSRVRESKAYLRAQGKVYGPLPYGFAEQDGMLVPNNGEMKVVRSIFKWRERGKGDAYIVKALNRKKIQTRRGKPWHRMTVRAILKRRDLYRPYLKKEAKRMPHLGVLG